MEVKRVQGGFRGGQGSPGDVMARHGGQGRSVESLGGQWDPFEVSWGSAGSREIKGVRRGQGMSRGIKGGYWRPATVLATTVTKQKKKKKRIILSRDGHLKALPCMSIQAINLFKSI